MGSMSDADRAYFRDNRLFLVRNLKMTEEFLACLSECKDSWGNYCRSPFLTDSARQEIKNYPGGDHEKAGKFCDTIIYRGHLAFGKYVEALFASKQQHILDDSNVDVSLYYIPPPINTPTAPAAKEKSVDLFAELSLEFAQIRPIEVFSERSNLPGKKTSVSPSNATLEKSQVEIKNLPFCLSLENKIPLKAVKTWEDCPYNIQDIHKRYEAEIDGIKSFLLNCKKHCAIFVIRMPMTEQTGGIETLLTKTLEEFTDAKKYIQIYPNSTPKVRMMDIYIKFNRICWDDEHQNLINVMARFLHLMTIANLTSYSFILQKVIPSQPNSYLINLVDFPGLERMTDFIPANDIQFIEGGYQVYEVPQVKLEDIVSAQETLKRPW